MRLLYAVCSKSITNFEFPRVMYIRFSFFCGEDEPKYAQAKQLSKINRTFKMAELVGISEGYEYRHDATKKSKI